ncbi:MAG: protein kinase domain-containing protein, partial [Limisphaerales bacterium]
QAVQHAHQKGVIHRDLKPANILVTEQDGRPVPKVIDFGIAKATEQRLTDKTLFTRFNQMVGTPAYMSPEQAGLGGLDVDTRTDIYALGVLLYELLTGRTPLDPQQLRGAGYEAMVRTIREAEPAKPSTRVSALKLEELTTLAGRRSEDPQRLRRLLRGDLDWIVLKALEKDRSRRYESATGLAADVRRYLDNEPIAARPPTVGYQFAKFAGKHRTALVTATAFVTVLVLGITASIWEALRANRLARAAAAAETAQRRLLYASDLGLAFQGWDLGRAGLVRELLEAHRPVPGHEDLRGWEWHYLWGASRLRELGEFRITNHLGLWSCALSVDGRWLAGGTGDGTVALWNVADAGLVTHLGDTVGIVLADSVAFSPDHRLLVHSRRMLRDVLVWAVGSARLVGQFTNALPVTRCALSPNGRWVAACGGDTYAESGPGELRLWNLETGMLQAEAPPQPSWLVNVRFSPDSRWLASADGQGQVKIWSVSGLHEAASLAHDATVFEADFSHEGNLLATCDMLGFVQVWRHDADTGSWTRVWRHQAHTGSCDRVLWSPDGRTLATGGRDQIVRLWDWESRRERSVLRGHAGRITGLAFSADSRRLFSASQDKTIRIWDATGPDRTDSQLPGGAELGLNVAFSPDGRWLARPAPSTRVELVELATRQTGGLVEGRWPAFSPDGRRMATIVSSNQAVLWSLDTREPLRSLTSVEPLQGPPVFSPDGTRLAAPAATGQIMLWRVDTGAAEATLATRAGLVAGLWFSADGNDLTVVPQSTGAIESFDLRSGLPRQSLATGDGVVLCAARAKDGGAFALGETGPGVRVWRRETGDTRLLNANAGSMVSVAWSPDGQTLAGGTFEGLVKLWNRRTLREVGTLRAHGSMVIALGFSPDGRHLVSAGLDGTTRIWTAPAFVETDAGK